MGDLGNKYPRCELGFFSLNLHLLGSQASKSLEAVLGDDILGHPNRVIPTPFLLPNLVSNHLTIGFLLDHIGGAIAFVPPVGLGVDERTLNYEFLLVLIIRKLLLWLRTLVGLVAFFVAL